LLTPSRFRRPRYGIICKGAICCQTLAVSSPQARWCAKEDLEQGEKLEKVEKMPKPEEHFLAKVAARSAHKSVNIWPNKK
jgi:hypothetical protein